MSSERRIVWTPAGRLVAAARVARALAAGLGGYDEDERLRRIALYLGDALDEYDEVTATPVQQAFDSYGCEASGCPREATHGGFCRIHATPFPPLVAKSGRNRRKESGS